MNEWMKEWMNDISLIIIIGLQLKREVEIMRKCKHPNIIVCILSLLSFYFSFILSFIQSCIHSFSISIISHYLVYLNEYHEWMNKYHKWMKILNEWMNE